MALDQRSTLIAQIAAAAAANALTELRFALTEGLAAGFSKDEIQTILKLAQDIQTQPQTHARQMAEQILREPATKTPGQAHSDHKHTGLKQAVHVHGPNCGCHS